MESDIVIATPAADAIILLGEDKRVRVLVNSTILRNASEEFDSLLAPVMDNQESQCDSKELPKAHLEDRREAAATLMLRFLHHDYDKSDAYDCEVIFDLASLVQEYDLIPKLGARLECIIGIHLDSCDDAEILSDLLIAAYNIRSSSKFREISAKLVRDGPKMSFYEVFQKTYRMTHFHLRLCIMLQAKRTQIDAKLLEWLQPVLHEPHECGCVSELAVLDLIMEQVYPCIDVKDGRTPKERMDQLQLAREELGQLSAGDGEACLSATDKCFVRIVQKCLGQAIQDIRQLSYEGLSLAVVLGEEEESEDEAEEED